MVEIRMIKYCIRRVSVCIFLSICTPLTAYAQLESAKCDDLSNLIMAFEGDAKSQVDIGVCLQAENDSVQAAWWYQQAAEQGLSAAQYYLGIMYHDGDGVPKDYKQARSWFKKAAEQGLSVAQQKLGTLYLNGEGVRQDYKQALSLFNQAAKQGEPFALFNLGIMYWNGEGVSQSYQECYFWFELAVSQGVKDAVVFRNDCESNMTTASVEDMQEKSAIYFSGF